MRRIEDLADSPLVPALLEKVHLETEPAMMTVLMVLLCGGPGKDCVPGTHPGGFQARSADEIRCRRIDAARPGRRKPARGSRNRSMATRKRGATREEGTRISPLAGSGAWMISVPASSTFPRPLFPMGGDRGEPSDGPGGLTSERGGYWTGRIGE